SSPVALVLFDLDPLPAGRVGAPRENIVPDRLVAAVGEQLRAQFRASDVIGRVGPTRFAALLADCSDSIVAAAEGIEIVSPADVEAVGVALTVATAHGAAEHSFGQLMLDAEHRMNQIKQTTG